MDNGQNNLNDFVGIDLGGFEFNKKYPPRTDLYGDKYDGYESPNKLTFFYDFCIQQYGVSFWFSNTHYETIFTGNGVILKNVTNDSNQGPFESPVDLLENAIIDGKPMVCILNDFDNVVLH